MSGEGEEPGERQPISEPLFRNIAGDARFKALLRKIDLPE